jgi:hypothetical protein
MGGWFCEVPLSLDIRRGALGVIYAPKVATELSQENGFCPGGTVRS